MTWDVHSCLFHVKTRSKEEGMITLTHALQCCLNWGVSTVICSATMTVKTAFIIWISWKNGHNLKDETLFLIKSILKYIYKTGSFQWSSTLMKWLKQFCICPVHVYWTKRPVLKMCTLTSLIFKHCDLKTSDFKQLSSWNAISAKKLILVYARAVWETVSERCQRACAREDCAQSAGVLNRVVFLPCIGQIHTLVCVKMLVFASILINTVI